jgi:stage II sporulation protein E
MPVMVWDVIPWLMICGMYVSWYTIYRYNAGYGIAVTGVCGMIMAIQTGAPELVGSMFIIAIIAMAGKVVSDRRKPGIFAGILLGSVVAGITYFDYFLTLEAVKTVGASALAFMLTPRQWMFVKDDTVYGRYNMETATEMNRITAEKIRELSGAFKRIEYTLAGCGTAAVKVNLGEIGDMIGRFSDNLENTESIPVYKENLLRDKLLEQGVILNNITSVKNEMNRRRYYITARTKGRKIMLSKDMAEIMSEVFRQSVRISEDTPAIISENNRVITFEENAGYRCYYNVRRIKKYGSNVSGDNFSVKEHEDGRLVMMISDGMGSGSLASCESTLLIDTMEEMMEAGFDPSYGIAFSNECISEKNNGCSFTTFDMGVIDLYDGNLKVYKQGAAATYVAHETGEGRSIEVIKGTTLPIGVLPEAECDVIETKLEDNDIIVMASDGIMDETCIEDVLNKTDSDNCKEILEDIVTSLLCLSQGKLRDDVTLIVARMEKNL